MAAPGLDTLLITLGDDYNTSYVWTVGGVPVNLTGVTINGHIASSYLPATTICSISGVITQPLSGAFTLNVPAAVSAAIAIPPGVPPTMPTCTVGVYDVVVTYPSGLKQTILNGPVKLFRTIT